jgi:hypothetical protein
VKWGQTMVVRLVIDGPVSISDPSIHSYQEAAPGLAIFLALRLMQVHKPHKAHQSRHKDTAR